MEKNSQNAEMQSCAREFWQWPALGPDGRALVIGTGGSLDVLAAYGVTQALSRHASPEAVFLYANADLQMDMRGWIETGNGCLFAHPGHAAVRSGVVDVSRAEARLPPGPEGSPYVFRLPYVGDAHIMDEEGLLDAITNSNIKHVSSAVCKLRPSLIVGVDVGGDILTGGARPDPRFGQDWQVVNALQIAADELGVPLHVAVLGPGADGESTTKQIQDVVAAASDSNVLGRTTIEGVLLEALLLARKFGVRAPHACPNILVDAAEGKLKSDKKGQVIVPRNLRPHVPPDWLSGCYVFDGRWVVSYGKELAKVACRKLSL